MRDQWIKRRLGDVISLEYGKTLPKDQRCEEPGFPAYGANGIKCYAKRSYWEHPSIIIGRKGTAGAVNLVDGGFWPLDVTFYVTFDDSEYDRKFLYFMLSALDLPSLATGVKPGINRNLVYAIEQEFPPLSEQKRIVAILDEAFAGIDAAIANTEKNLANARELFDGYLNSVFGEPDESWLSHRIGDVCTLKSGTSLGKRYENSSGDIAYIKVSDLSHSGNEHFIVGSSRYLNRNDISEKNIFPRGSVIFPKRGGAIATNKKRQTAIPICADLNIIGVIPSPYLNSRLLYFYFLQVNMAEIGGGSSIPQINNYDISPLSISFPESLEEQSRVTSILEEIELQTRSLESIYERKLEAFAELKQSFLQKAFSGELTAEAAEKEADEAVA